jgi:hypothetical protein
MGQESLDIIGLFIFISGFVIGLGSVIVIDLHGFLGRKSSYWTEATIRTHKVTKPLIWLGITLTIVGGFILYRNESFSGIPLIHTIGALLLVINGIFLSFYVSPFLIKKEKEGKQKELLPHSLQFKIILSLIFSDVVWWGSLFLLVRFIIQKF